MERVAVITAADWWYILCTDVVTMRHMLRLPLLRNVHRPAPLLQFIGVALAICVLATKVVARLRSVVAQGRIGHRQATAVPLPATTLRSVSSNEEQAVAADSVTRSPVATFDQVFRTFLDEEKRIE